jgi:hypothetical protein
MYLNGIFCKCVQQIELKMKHCKWRKGHVMQLALPCPNGPILFISQCVEVILDKYYHGNIAIVSQILKLGLKYT